MHVRADNFISRERRKSLTDMTMISPGRILLLACLVLTGCSVARDAAVTSFRILDTPANYIRQRIDHGDDETTTTTTTTTTEFSEPSDVRNPGRPLDRPGVVQRGAPPDRAGVPPRSTTRSSRDGRSAGVEPSPRPRRTTPSTTPRPSPPQVTQFPTAKPVPGRPGYVYSVDPKGGIVDVTGYKPGDKAKDPYTQQIFIVP